jgi:thiosulfate/3-mercaptopyruvate sulfurtransferase
MTDYPPPAGIDRSILATREDVVEALGSHAELLCDVRTRDEYEGRGEPGRMARRMGHIPQSRWLPWESALAAGGSFLSPDELRAALAPLLADERPKITYCQGGIRASNTWFALSEILGVPARMYAASWEEWGNRDDTPIER